VRAIADHDRHISLVNPSPDNISLTSVRPFSPGSQNDTDNLASAIINSTATNQINLKGIAIGNGWIDPLQQYPGYVDFAYEKGLIKKDSPVRRRFSSMTEYTDGQEATHVEEILARCQTQMDMYTDPFNTPVNINGCGGVMDAVSEPFVQE
jgi:carboxypeptidase D